MRLQEYRTRTQEMAKLLIVRCCCLFCFVFLSPLLALSPRVLDHVRGVRFDAFFDECAQAQRKSLRQMKDEVVGQRTDIVNLVAAVQNEVRCWVWWVGLLSPPA